MEKSGRGLYKRERELYKRERKRVKENYSRGKELYNRERERVKELYNSGLTEDNLDEETKKLLSGMKIVVTMVVVFLLCLMVFAMVNIFIIFKDGLSLEEQSLEEQGVVRSERHLGFYNTYTKV